ncbi:MAG: protein kinase [Planctomycetota bacterium]|jgi:serine/threonine-protein kinase|nr:protein kinase [Planctomycetota bacterium]
MSKEIPCPHCKQKFQLPDTRRPLVTCPHCSKKFAIKRAASSNESKRVGTYELIEKLGEGKMGMVYKAKDASGKVVALKLMNSTLARGKSFIKRFQREAEASKTFDHPFLVKAFDYGEADGLQFYAMEFIDGEDLEVKLRRGETLDEGQSLYVAKCVGEGLRFAWEKTIVHRDIKPANIMIENDGRIRLMDMGLAKDVSDSSATVTQAGGVLGSPAYAAPEQLEGKVDVDVRADIYALGTTLFHLACGRQPFTGDTAGVVAANNMTLPLPDPREFKAELTEPFCAFLKKLTEKKAENRYQNPAEVLEAVEKVLMGEMPATAAAKLPTRKVERDKGITSGGLQNKLAIPAAIVAVLGMVVLGIVLYSNSRSKKSRVTRIRKPPGKKHTTPTRRAPLLGEQYAPVEGIGLHEVYHTPMKVEAGMATLAWDFSSSEQLQDWGYRGQVRGPLFCTPSGIGPRGAYLAKGLRLEAEATLLKGTTLKLVLSGRQNIALNATSPEGSYLEWKKGQNDFVTSDKKPSVAPEEKTRLTLEITETGIKALVGDKKFEVQGKVESEYVIRIGVEQKVGRAVLDRFQISGLPAPEWARAEMARVANRKSVAGTLTSFGRGGNLALAVSAGTTIALPKDFHALTKWSIEAYVFLYRMNAAPAPPLVLLGQKNGGNRIAISGSNRITFHLAEGQKKHRIVSQNALSRGQWHHVAVTKDGVDVKIFLDGQLDTRKQVPPEHATFKEADYFVGLEKGGDPSALSFIDDYTISQAVMYESSFNPKPPSIAGASTWLLFEFLEGEGNVARNTARANADGQLTGGIWLKTHLPELHYSKVQRLLRNKSRIWVELQAHDRWQTTGIVMRKGQTVQFVKMTYFKQIDLGSTKGLVQSVSEPFLSARIGDSAEIPVDLITQEFEAPESGVLSLRNSGPPRDILIHVLLR